ncbi:MAG: hypothetical protein KC443_25725, partial [Anaerolineales bacterium]|nr:hypothetical protein [Anaerolineales bacterium]
MAISHDSTTALQINTASFSHTCTGSNLTLVVPIWIFDGSADITVTDITYNSVSLTQRRARVETFGGRYWRVEIWTLDSPATGSNTVAVTLSGTPSGYAVGAISYTGANNGVGTTGDNSSNDNNPSTTHTSTTSNGLNIMAAVMRGGDSDPFAPDGSETERYDGATGTNTNTDIGMTLIELASTGGSDTLSTTASVSDLWVSVMIELLAASSGVSIACNVGTLTLTGQQAAVAPGAVSVDASVGNLALAGQQAAIVPGAVGIALNTGTLALAGQQAAIVPGAVGIALNTGTLALAG